MKYLILLTFLLSACAASPTAPAPEQPQATPQMVQPAATRASEHTATPAIDRVATEIFLIHELQTAQADTAALRDQIAGQNIQAEQIKLDTQKSVEETAKYNAAQADSEARRSQTDAQIEKSKVDAMALQVEAERLEVERIQAEAAAENAKAAQILQVCVIAILAIGAIVALRLVSRYPAQAGQPVDENQADRHARVEHYARTSGPYPGEMLVDGIPATRTQLQFIAALVIGQGVDPSHGNSTPSSICFSRGGFVAFCDFLDTHEYADRITDQNGQLRGVHFTEGGRAFLMPYFDNPGVTSPTPQGCMSVN
jgi:hypothetical protein